jgi:8-oxo-dGTP pyrophosphatase MutT (NUDIX family)
MRQGQVRPIALCIFRQDDRVLVAEYYDPSKNQTFYRPLGGTIEFGERGQQTVEREIREELGATVADLHYLATFENLFVYNGQQGHEIVLMYEGRFTDRAIYDLESVAGHDDGDLPLKAVWRQLNSFGPSAPMYPDGLLELLATGDATVYHIYPVGPDRAGRTKEQAA